LNEKHEVRIFRPFLLTLGVMRRVLGYEGVKIITKKLKEIEFFRSKDLLSIDLDEYKEKKLLNYLMKFVKQNLRIKMKSKKRVGSTAASKVLHLICSDLFIMWDSEIRKKYIS
jgi:hypothetical protein